MDLETPIHRWAKIGLKETGWESTDWIDVAQDVDLWWALVNTVMNLCVP
jgi:hypothetical protein